MLRFFNRVIDAMAKQREDRLQREIGNKFIRVVRPDGSVVYLPKSPPEAPSDDTVIEPAAGDTVIEPPPGDTTIN